jgi:defect-in-organelle-trafficking protein DotA
MLITTLLLLPGAILAYYVPLYPFAVFTFAAIGWILMVVEGMAAAPLVCVGMTHPEGHDFLGKAEQALMLFLGIFLRPALMVIGLVTAMVISFVAFSMLTSGFGTVLNSLIDSSHSAFGNGFLVLISNCMVLIIFGMMTMELIEQCYKLIYQLPNAILQWIGGPQTGQDFGQMAQGVRGAVSAGAGAGREFMSGADKAGDTAASTAKHDKEQMDKDSTGISGGGGGAPGAGSGGGGGGGGGGTPPAV